MAASGTPQAINPEFSIPEIVAVVEGDKRRRKRKKKRGNPKARANAAKMRASK